MIFSPQHQLPTIEPHLMEVGRILNPRVCHLCKKKMDDWGESDGVFIAAKCSGTELPPLQATPSSLCPWFGRVLKKSRVADGYRSGKSVEIFYRVYPCTSGNLGIANVRVYPKCWVYPIFWVTHTP